MSNKSGVSEQVISLPKGGGAIKGIGETFQPDLFTGTGNFSIPIYASPGREGFGPQITLQYSTGNGNSPFGLGWQLSIPRITRKTEKGLPTYTDEDVFVMSGAEDLVPQFEENTTEIDVTPRNDYTITRYRPRTEGLFARIEKWEHDDGDVHWRAITKDNVTSLYGKTEQARIADPENQRHVYEWLLEETFDAKGNHILYEYAREPDDLVVDAIYEQNRSYRSQRYIRRILYGNVAQNLTNVETQREGTNHQDPFSILSRRYVFELLFDYRGTDSEPIHAYVRPPDDGQEITTKEWSIREDPFSHFRAGFEIRTLRRCKRVLMFHHFPELGHATLVKSTDFTHKSNPDTLVSFLTSAAVTGYKKENGTYHQKRMPPITFTYSEFKPHEQRYQPLQAKGHDMPSFSLGNPDMALVDLLGNGLPDVLHTSDTGFRYWENLGDGLFDRPQSMPQVPAGVRLSQPGVSFADMAGDGRADLLVLSDTTKGFYETTLDGTWETFKRFDTFPSFDLGNPSLRMLDLTGDGLTDILVTRSNYFVWFECLGEAGYAPPRYVARVHDLDAFPDIQFNDPAGRVRLADMTGDGLNDIVWIHNGSIDYWPNLGYGRFGKRVTMANAPKLEQNFDPSRLFLADIDGSGCADLVYVDFDRVHFAFNRSGNGWSDMQIIHGTPATTNATDIQFADIFGIGMATLLWTYNYGQVQDSHYKALDFCGGVKPYILIEMNNNMGATTRVRYAPSTQYWLADEARSESWATKLPFPVQVVDKVEVIDHISKTRLTTNYAYHHGYFDGHEREFRGFGRVEQCDTEAFEDYVVGVEHIEGNQDLAPEVYQPPVTTRTWYHTGAFFDRERIVHQLRDEYYRKEQYLPEPVLPSELDAQATRECLRALRGLPLRQEIYSFDGSPEEQHPYSVVENNFEVRLLQSRGEQKHAIFFPIGSESISLNYERNPEDPRISHSLNLEVDEYGNAVKSCAVVYGRRVADTTLPDEVTRDQQKTYITYTEVDYTPDIDHVNPPQAYRLRVPYETRSYEITGITPDSGLFKLAEIETQIANTAEIAYEVVADNITPQKRLLAHERTLFLGNDLNPLSLGQWNSLGLIYQGYQLAFTPGIISTQYANKISEAECIEAGYVHFDGDDNWWIPTGTTVYPADPADHFYIPTGTKDPLGLETQIQLDRYDLLTERVQVAQAPWNEIIATNDYRVLGPVLITDPNKNRSAVEIDALGMVVKSAIMGKQGTGDGDTLADPTVRMEYDLFNWMNHRKPNFVHTFAREKHGVANPRWQESYTYSNGSGGVALVKVQANPGKALQANLDGMVTEVDSDPRWIGNGRTILNNKGNPVKQYEPYFSTTHEYEDEKALREIGATPILYYDAIGRNIRTLFPNGTFAKVEFNPWMQKVFDANDTVKVSQWYADRGSPDPATESEPEQDPDRRAAWLAAKHADTPETIHFDSLGRPIYAVSDYGGEKTAAVRSENDLTGRFSKLFDQKEREVASGFIGMAGTPVTGESAEKGCRWTFQNVLGALVRTWDEHGREFRVEYDQLHRPVGTFVKEPGRAEILFNYVLYGDRHPDALQRNLLGVAHQIFDQAGKVQVPELDFKGNPKQVERVLARDYKNPIDWLALTGYTGYDDIQTAADSALETDEAFAASAQYDALNRPIQVTLPDDSVVLPTYNEANFLASLKVQINGQGDFIKFLQDQDYDAKGQRQFAHYGNDVFTRYFYDPKTFRLTDLQTYRSGDNPETKGLQNVHYTYDPVGNITQIRDDAQQTHFFNNAVVKPESLFEYDAIYQLIRATGREHAGPTNSTIRTHNDLGDLDSVPHLPHANAANAVRKYTEAYEYDVLGNIKMLRHSFKPQARVNGWTRRYYYAYEADSSNRANRLHSTSTPDDGSDAGPYSATYDYDDYGNMTQMPHLDKMVWDSMDQLQQVDLGGGGTAYYVYDVGGQRIRKVIERQGSTRTERIYLGAVEIYRERKNTDPPHFERYTLHISDDTGRIAQVDTKTKDDNTIDPDNRLDKPLIRYQYSNHLGSVMLETDADGQVISYEEYHPYGTTAYRSAKPGENLSLKRFRFSGKELDSETGLYYFGARYYAAWLGRWTSCDPAGFVDSLNLFVFVYNNPINNRDLFGLETYREYTSPEDIPLPDLTDPSEEVGRVFEKTVESNPIENPDETECNGIAYPPGSYMPEGEARYENGEWIYHVTGLVPVEESNGPNDSKEGLVAPEPEELVTPPEENAKTRDDITTAGDLARTWERKYEESSRILDRWTEDSPSMTSVLTATFLQTAMDLGAGFVDMLKFGEGLAEGGWGIGKDILRGVGLAAPMLRVFRAFHPGKVKCTALDDLAENYAERLRVASAAGQGELVIVTHGNANGVVQVAAESVRLKTLASSSLASPLLKSSLVKSFGSSIRIVACKVGCAPSEMKALANLTGKKVTAYLPGVKVDVSGAVVDALGNPAQSLTVSPSILSMQQIGSTATGLVGMGNALDQKQY